MNLEWSRQAAANSGRGFNSRYTLCSTLFLYRADSSSYQLENSASRCSVGFNNEQGVGEDAFMREFVYGKSSDKSVNLEDVWLAEAASLISRRRGEFKRIAVKEVTLADNTYPGDNDAREKLRLYLSEKFSSDLSKVLRKPIIPPALSSSGQLSLRFRDNTRNRNIKLPPAAHSLSLKILPFQRKITSGELKGQQLETYFSLISMSHVNALGDSHLNGAGFYRGSRPRLLLGASELGDIDRIQALVSDSANLELLDFLTTELASQFAKPDKAWVHEHAYKTDPLSAFSGLEKIAKELSK